MEKLKDAYKVELEKHTVLMYTTKLEDILDLEIWKMSTLLQFCY